MVLLSRDRTYYKCKLSQYDSLCTANHKEDLTRVSNNTSNFRRHFNTQHHSIFLAMDNAVKAGEDPRRTLATILSTRRLKTPATTIDQLLWGRSTIQSKTNHFLSGKKRKEIALLLWLTHSAIPPNSMVNDFWHTFCEESGIAISEIGTIWKLLGVLSAAVVQDEEERLCKMYSFVTSMDLWTSGGGGHFLVVNYYGIICDDGSFDLWYGTLDLIPFYSRAFAYTICAVVEKRITEHSKGITHHQQPLLTFSHH